MIGSAAAKRRPLRFVRLILGGILTLMAIGESSAGAVYCELEDLVLRINDHPEVRLKPPSEVSRALENCGRLISAERDHLAEKVDAGGTSCSTTTRGI